MPANAFSNFFQLSVTFNDSEEQIAASKHPPSDFVNPSSSLQDLTSRNPVRWYELYHALQFSTSIFPDKGCAAVQTWIQNSYAPVLLHVMRYNSLEKKATTTANTFPETLYHSLLPLAEQYRFHSN